MKCRLSEKKKAQILVLAKKISDGIIFLSVTIILGTIITYFIRPTSPTILIMPNPEEMERLRKLWIFYHNIYIPSLILSSVVLIIAFNSLRYAVSRKLKNLGYEKKINATINTLKVQRIQADGYFFPAYS
jgi:hypothetical protein